MIQPNTSVCYRCKLPVYTLGVGGNDTIVCRCDSGPLLDESPKLCCHFSKDQIAIVNALIQKALSAAHPFEGHVYVKCEDYAALCRAAKDPEFIRELIAERNALQNALSATQPTETGK